MKKPVSISLTRLVFVFLNPEETYEKENKEQIMYQFMILSQRITLQISLSITSMIELKLCSK